MAGRLLSLVVIVSLLHPALAQADDSGASAGAAYFNTWLQQHSQPSNFQEQTTAASNDITYYYDPMCVRGSGTTSDGFYGCGDQQTCGTGGLLFNVWAQSDSGSSLTGTWCDQPSQAAPAEVLTPGRILEAFRRIPVPASPIGVNPVGGRTLVNFDTIFHTEAQPFTRTVRLLGRNVTFDITPSEFTWNTGEGSFTTSDPGRAYKPSLPMSAYVTHRYLKAGKVQLGLETTWAAQWRVGNGPWRPVDGTVTTTSPRVPLQVVTARPQLVTYD